MLVSYVDIMRTYKENYLANIKNKKGKEEMVSELEKVL